MIGIVNYGPTNERKTMTQSEYLSCAETAKLVRAALKAEFPGIKFSVRSSTYAGGASIHTSWVDGPTGADVDAVQKLYAGATFDGMIDLKSYHTSLLVDEDGNPREVHFGADFVFGQRRLSEEKQAELEAEIAEAARRPFEMNELLNVCVIDGKALPLQGGNDYGSDLLHRLSGERRWDKDGNLITRKEQ